MGHICGQAAPGPSGFQFSFRFKVSEALLFSPGTGLDFSEASTFVWTSGLPVSSRVALAHGVTVVILKVCFFPRMCDRNGGRRLRQWLIEQIDSGMYPGLIWENDEKTMFRIPWKHAGKQDYNQEVDASIFKVTPHPASPSGGFSFLSGSRGI